MLRHGDFIVLLLLNVTKPELNRLQEETSFKELRIIPIFSNPVHSFLNVFTVVDCNTG